MTVGTTIERLNYINFDQKIVDDFITLLKLLFKFFGPIMPTNALFIMPN